MSGGGVPDYDDINDCSESALFGDSEPEQPDDTGSDVEPDTGSDVAVEAAAAGVGAEPPDIADALVAVAPVGAPPPQRVVRVRPEIRMGSTVRAYDDGYIIRSLHDDHANVLVKVRPSALRPTIIKHRAPTPQQLGRFVRKLSKGTVQEQVELIIELAVLSVQHRCFTYLGSKVAPGINYVWLAVGSTASGQKLYNKTHVTI